MLPLQSPLDAYRSDLSRNPGRNDFGSADTVWLLVTHCLHRLTRVPVAARGAIASHCASALADLQSTVQSAPEDHYLPGVLGELRLALDEFESRDAADALSRTIRAMADRMADAGALSLAYASVGHLRCAAPHASPRENGLNLGEQARIARLLGDLDGAEELYVLQAEVGTDSGEPDLVVRSSLGRGVVARVRGNYPRARELFQTGLADAREAGLDSLALIAHQGLLIAAGVAGDFDTALVHGWAAFQLAGTDEETRLQMLVNLAQLALDAGYPSAALRGALALLSQTPVLRLRLAALGSAVIAASELGDRGTAEQLRAIVDRDVERSLLPYENAQALRSVSRAYGMLGEPALSESYRMRARTLAKRGGFFELVLATEPAPEAPAPKRPRELQPSSWRVIESLEQLPADESELAVARS